MSDPLWMAEIKDRVAAFYGVTALDMMSERRSASIVWPRHVAIYLCRRHTRFSMQGIGRAFGDREWSTVRYAIRRVEEQMSLYPTLEREVETLSAEIEVRNSGPRSTRPDLHDAEKAGRRRELLAALLRCHRRRLGRQDQALNRRRDALDRLEARVGL